MLKHLMPTCKELADETAAGRVERLGFFDRLRFRLHGWLCPPCRRYVRQLDSIGEVARDSARADEPCPEDVQAMKRRCLEKLERP